MHWQVEVELLPSVPDSLGHRVEKEVAWAGLGGDAAVRTTRLFLLVGDLDRAGAETLARDLLTDPVIETWQLADWERHTGDAPGCVTIFRKPGVMDPAEANILRGAACLGFPLEGVKTAVRYRISGLEPDALREVGRRFLANEAIEEVVVGNDRFPADRKAESYGFALIRVPLRGLDDQGLLRVSREGALSLDLEEMRAVRGHFRELGREPTDVELETIAQTWSEHCKHKTFTSPIRYSGPPVGSLASGTCIPGLLKATVKDATLRLDRSFCLSVFHDNAGVIAFHGPWALCFKVETHNHPSAIEPYGGAGTGVGGVIRDVLGTGLGARPVANTDVFCVGPLDTPPEEVPRGALHPLRVLRGVVAGVRDYGNQMGIPTVNGAVLCDPRYAGNPLVYCGTVGLLPADKVHKQVRPGDRIVVLGGRTGRDGIHGATFSSVELHEESESLDSGAVQIGDAITEKKVLDVLLQARDRGLFDAVTDCGAGGFSSAVGEMGADCGCRVDLEQAPLKYAGLSYTEIWISEAQERMVLSVPPDKVDELLELCTGEDVEAVVLGSFTDTGRLELYYQGHQVADLSMEFLHRGVPLQERQAHWEPPPGGSAGTPELRDPGEVLLRILAAPNVASKEWIVRQYDHEVQGGSVVKPLVGTRGHGPSDGAVQAPLLGETVGFALGAGMNPHYGDYDPYVMARAAVDEALRNVVAVGGDPDHCALLDNFSWGNCARPGALGGLVRAAYGCRDAALTLGTPFISGKDSLNNEFRVGERTISIPASLLISAIARVPDVRRAVTMDLKRPGSMLYVVGATEAELGGSHLMLLHGLRGDRAPELHAERALETFRALHQAIRKGLLLAVHDLSEGGLAVAAAEMVLAGGVGARIDIDKMPVAGDPLTPVELAFSESLSRFLVEVAPGDAAAVADVFGALPAACVGETREEPRLELMAGGGTWVDLPADRLEAAWRPPLSRHLEGEEARA